MLKVAVVPVTVPVPSVVVPSMNVTVPVKLLPYPAKVAVNVTGAPPALGLAELARVVLVVLVVEPYSNAPISTAPTLRA